MFALEEPKAVHREYCFVFGHKYSCSNFETREWMIELQSLEAACMLGLCELDSII